MDEAGKEVELGRGAFGVVLKGRYRLMPVAIKRLLLQSPEQQALFLKEMAILRACRGSRYIVPFVGASLQPVGPPFCSVNEHVILGLGRLVEGLVCPHLRTEHQSQCFGLLHDPQHMSSSSIGMRSPTAESLAAASWWVG